MPSLSYKKRSDLTFSGLCSFYPRRSALSLPSLQIGMEYFLPLATRMCTPRTWKYIIDRLPLEEIRRTKYMVDEIEKTSREIYEAKKGTVDKGDENTLQQVVRGKDLISLLSE